MKISFVLYLCLFVALILIMRTLFYVPVIHTSADMGSLAKALTSCGISQVGERMWQEHVATVHRYWDVIALFCDTLPAQGLKIYQDGLVADGEIGLKIVAAGVQSGSRNYQIVEKLIKNGAEIIKTEDFKLVLEERDRILEVVDAPTHWAKICASLKYRFIKHQLLSRRDSFIARRIDETLGEGEAGILFIGAYHRVREKLPKDIKVIEIKETDKVQQYQKLLPFCHQQSKKFNALNNYLMAPIKQEYETLAKVPQEPWPRNRIKCHVGNPPCPGVVVATKPDCG